MQGSIPFGSWLKHARQTHDLTQEALAERVGCAVQTIRTFERGLRRPSRDMADRLADVLHVPLAERETVVRMARTPLIRTTRPPEQGTCLTPDVGPVDQHLVVEARQAQLPTPPNALIGRQAEQAALHTLLADATHRLVTLIGPGGVGKTRLALQVAHDVAPAFPDGAVWVSLASATSPPQVATTITDTLGAPPLSGDVPEAHLLQVLRTRQMLLVLDNFEHLVAAAYLLESIVQQAPHVRLLVTSRQRLYLPGEWIVAVEGLPVAATDSQNGIERSPAALLFLQRASQVDQSFVARPQNRATLLQICRVLDGMPLAIELAAAWVRVLPITEILAELSRSSDLLQLPAGTAPGTSRQHTSMRAVFDRSWALLSPPEQRVLRALSVFHGGFTRDAAQHVCGASLPLLAALVDKSLVRRMSDGINPPRYDLHPLVRQYATDRLVEKVDARAAVQAHHASYFTHLLAARLKQLLGVDQHAAVLELASEVANIRVAWHWMVAHDRIGELEPAFEALYLVCEYRMWFRDGEELFRVVVDALDVGVPARSGTPRTVSSERASLLGHAQMRHGYFLSRTGQFAAALERLRDGVAGLRHGGGCAALLTGMVFYGVVAFQMGDMATAAQQITVAFERATVENDRWHIALSATWQGMLAQARGEHLVAKRWFEQALATWRETGSPRGILFCLTFFSLTLHALGDLDAAEASLHESLELSSQTNDPWGIGTALNHLGMVALARGDHQEAQWLFDESLAVFREGGNRWDITRALNNLGEVLMTLEQVKEAERCYREALHMAVEGHVLPAALQALFGLATLSMQRGAYSAALELLGQIAQHPHTDKPMCDRVHHLRSQIDAEVDGHTVELVQQRVRDTAFTTFVATILRSSGSGCA